MITLYDFTKCKIDLTANYGGSDKKRGIILYNKKYIFIFNKNKISRGA